MKQILLKLHTIMSEVGYIQKDKKNTVQSYTYASEKAIKEELHKALVKNKVLFYIETANPRVEKVSYVTRAGNNDAVVTFIDVIYHFMDVESGEEVKGVFVGSGQARDEKGNYAAITGAIKYILTSTFLIPTGDDPEADETSQKVSQPVKKTTPTKPAETQPSQPTTASQTSITGKYEQMSIGALRVEISQAMRKGLVQPDYASVAKYTREEMIDALNNIGGKAA